MAANAADAQLPAEFPISEKLVRSIEELSPVIPLAACLMWGTSLILLSFALNLAKFLEPVQKLGVSAQELMGEGDMDHGFGGVRA
jgi:hypothetical protein